jgi:hypothetical protein
MELFADNPDVAFDPMIPGDGTLLAVSNHDNFFLSMHITFSSNYFAVPALACVALLTTGCSEKKRHKPCV